MRPFSTSILIDSFYESVKRELSFKIKEIAEGLTCNENALQKNKLSYRERNLRYLIEQMGPIGPIVSPYDSSSSRL